MHPYPNSLEAKVESEVARAMVMARDLRKRRVDEYKIRREKRIVLEMTTAQESSSEKLEDSDHHTSTMSSFEDGSIIISSGSGSDLHSSSGCGSSVMGETTTSALVEITAEQDANNKTRLSQ